MNTLKNCENIDQTINSLINDTVCIYDVYCIMQKQNVILNEYFNTHLKCNKMILFNLNITSNFIKILIQSFINNINKILEISDNDNDNDNDNLHNNLHNNSDKYKVLKDYVNNLLISHKIKLTLDLKEIQYSDLEILKFPDLQDQDQDLPDQNQDPKTSKKEIKEKFEFNF